MIEYSMQSCFGEVTERRLQELYWVESGTKRGIKEDNKNAIITLNCESLTL